MTKRILLIDDEQDIVAVTEARLKYLGYKVFTAQDTKEALLWLEKNTTDLILLDLLLPGMRGEEFCKLLKSNDKFKDVPVILFTATSSDVPRIVQETGADGYIIKPFEADELLKKIKKIIGQEVNL